MKITPVYAKIVKLKNIIKLLATFILNTMLKKREKKKLGKAMKVSN